MKLSGWGRYPCVETNLLRTQNSAGIDHEISAQPSLIARGLGRAYGDAALNTTAVLAMDRLDRLRDFDPATGLLTCEAGLSLAELIEFALPRGFFPTVTPGTKFVTVGGAIAADVHGKNHHHVGSLGDSVVSFDLLTADGVLRHCTRDSDLDLFNATCGGMGLTGIIVAATLRLTRVETAYIRQETLRAANLDEAMSLCASSADWPYTVAWIDCVTGGDALGRSLIYRGAHASPSEVKGDPLKISPRRPKTVPIDFPNFTLNRWTVQAFNELYYRRGQPGVQIVDYDRYFYPLDALYEWNRIYGRAGFMQYQCVLPPETSSVGLRSLLERMVAAKSGSFLAVLKLFGPQSDGYLSFPMEGYTLALDFPVNPANFRLCEELDRIVAAHGGRIYLAKDSRQSAAMFRQGYPKLDAFKAVRRRIDPDGKFSSEMSKRLEL